MTRELEEYIDITRKCAEQCETMLAFEQEKRRALLSDDGQRLEAVLSGQQAAIMTLDTLEKRRLASQQAAGYSVNATASEVLEAIPEGPDQKILGELLGRLGRTAEEIRSLNKTAMEIANMNLQTFSHLSQAAKVEKRPTYGPGQQKKTGWTGGSSFEQKI